VADWLSAEWATELVAALGDWPGTDGPAPVELSFTVLGAPGGDVTGTHRLWPGGEGAARQVALTLPVGETRALIAGELAPSVAFMRGRMKTSGDPGALLEVLEATATSAWDEIRGRVSGLDGGR
jgi:hypothetical protein